MDAKIINPFIRATMNVIKTMARIDSTAGKPFLKKQETAIGDISGVIGIYGETDGSIAVSFEESSVLAIVSNMFGETMKSIDNDVIDAVGEITNMISGQARMELETLGRHFQAAIPSVFTGKNHLVTHVARGPRIAIPFTTPNGAFVIEVCLER